MMGDIWHIIVITGVAALTLLTVWLIAKHFESRVEVIINTRFSGLVVALSDRYNDAIREANDAKRSALVTHGELVKLEAKFARIENTIIKLEEAWLKTLR
jgi:hypothetical protein